MPILIPDNLPYTPRGIECLRFGARRGGDGIGCCAVDVIQGFGNPPDAICPQKPFYDGDSWAPVFYSGTSRQLCVGGENITNEQAFLAYLTHGSFTSEPEPDHAFIAILAKEQCEESSSGKKWLAILKREGFEWVGCTSNSVYGECHPNHIFMLIRSTHTHMEDSEIESLKRPPQIWDELPKPTETPEERYRYLCDIFRSYHTPATEEVTKAQTLLRVSSLENA